MNIPKLKKMIYLIDQKRTGAPVDLAKSLGISERMVYYYVDLLRKEINAPIKYNRYRKTYEFSEKGSLNWNWDSKLDKN